MGMKEIITVKASKVQVGDIICGTTWSKDEGTGINWVPSQTVVKVAVDQVRGQDHAWWLVTDCMDSGYQDELGPFFADSELHVVARSVGDALIGRGR
jgi:hypothetical protein